VVGPGLSRVWPQGTYSGQEGLWKAAGSLARRKPSEINRRWRITQPGTSQAVLLGDASRLKELAQVSHSGVFSDLRLTQRQTLKGRKTWADFGRDAFMGGRCSRRQKSIRSLRVRVHPWGCLFFLKYEGSPSALEELLPN
jgi:hypothetical protein